MWPQAQMGADVALDGCHLPVWALRGLADKLGYLHSGKEGRIMTWPEAFVKAAEVIGAALVVCVIAICVAFVRSMKI